MEKAKFYNIKAISLSLILLGLFISIIFGITETKNWQNYQVRSHDYSFVNPISGKTVYSSGSEIGELSLVKFALSKYMNSGIYIEAIAAFGAFFIVAILIYASCFNQELILSNKGICGKALKGKTVEIEYGKITSIKKTWLKGIALRTIGQEKISFGFVKNQAVIIESIEKAISTKAQPVSEIGTVAGQIVKYKALLDEGIISQEEFELKKKQLLEM